MTTTQEAAELVERLRDTGLHSPSLAADLIEAQATRIAELEALVERARDALETATEWIKGWDVGFLFDDEWPADEAKIKATISALRAHLEQEAGRG